MLLLFALIIFPIAAVNVGNEFGVIMKGIKPAEIIMEGSFFSVQIGIGEMQRKIQQKILGDISSDSFRTRHLRKKNQNKIQIHDSAEDRG